MSSKHWFGAAAAALLLSFTTSSAQAAPVGISSSALKDTTVTQSDVQIVHWRRHWHRWHRRYYYYGGYPGYYYGGYPGYYYGGYPYAYYRPGFSFYGRGFSIHIGRGPGWW